MIPPFDRAENEGILITLLVAMSLII